MAADRWTVTYDADSIVIHDPSGGQGRVSRSDLARIVIATTDEGPFAPDVWWLLFEGQGGPPVAFPQGAAGEAELVDQLMSLDGFDHAAMIAAMGSVETSLFPVWSRRPADED